MKNVALTISGNRYEIKLEDEFADFVNKDLVKSGVNLNTDNKPDKLLKAYLRLAKQLLKAYLRLAKQATSYEDEIELLIETLDAL